VIFLTQHLWFGREGKTRHMVQVHLDNSSRQRLSIPTHKSPNHDLTTLLSIFSINGQNVIKNNNLLLFDVWIDTGA